VVSITGAVAAWSDAAVAVDAAETGALSRIALALTSTLELQEVLERIVSVALETSGASRASLLLLDGDSLVPRVALGAEPNEEEFQRFLRMRPIALGPIEREVINEGHAVGIEDARTSALLPPAWTEAFQLRRVGLVPLMTGGAPCGLMVVDWREPSPFSGRELQRLEALASYAGLAVGNARLFERERRSAALQAALARAAAELCRSHEPEAIARHLIPAFVDVLGAQLCGIALLDLAGQRFHTLASRGARRMPAPAPLAEVPAHITERLTAVWDVDRSSLVELEADEPLRRFLGADRSVTHYLVLPMVIDGHSRGLVVLGFDDATVLDADERAAAEALAALAAATLEREGLVERLNRQLRQLDALHRLSGALTDRADAPVLVAGLNELLAGHGVRVTDIVVRDRKLARYLAGDEPVQHRPRLTEGAADPDCDDVVVPMRLGRRTVGELHVCAASHGADDLAFLQSLAAGLAEIINRGAQRASTEALERERAIATERDRMAADIHDTAGQMFVAIGLLARRYSEEIEPDDEWAVRTRRLAELADRGKWETDQAVRALAFLPATKQGLVPALTALAESFAADSGINVIVNVEGRATRLLPRLERALYRVAHDAFINSWRHARCHVIRAEVAFAKAEVGLVIVDDGVGLDPSQSNGNRMGMASMRRTIEDVGGWFQVRNGDGAGLVMEAIVPRERR
jgi:signal transduction histidine kinase